MSPRVPEAHADRVRQYVPLAPLTTIGVGGEARFLWRPRSGDEAVIALEWARRNGLKTLILGGGSNLAPSSEGFDGLVIQPGFAGMETWEEEGRVMVVAEAGLVWDELVARCVAHGLRGLSSLSGIPGMVGAAPMQNIGAYGQEVAETIQWVETRDLATGAARRFDKEACGFAYRDSRFKRTRDQLITRVCFALERCDRNRVRYPDLIAEMGEEGDLATIRAAVLKVRGRKSMLVNADDPDARSCGSFFTNPILDAEAHAAVVPLLGKDCPQYELGDGLVKIPAAWLIERAGFAKGHVDGRVGLSSKHCLALINRGGATSDDVKRLAATIQAGVRARFGIQLEPEPVLL